MAKYSSPTFILKQLFNDINKYINNNHTSNIKIDLSTLNIYDIIQTTVAILNDDQGIQLVMSSEKISASASKALIDDDDYDIEFYIKNSLAYYMNHLKCDWHMTLNRSIAISPSVSSRFYHVFHSMTYRTLSGLLTIQAKLAEASTTCMNDLLKNQNTNQQLVILKDLINTNDQIYRDELHETLSIDNWLFSIVYGESSPLLNMMNSLFSSYQNNPTETRYLVI